MKKFEFQLEQVLGVRRFQQEQAEIELGRALGEEQAIQSKLDTVALQHTAVVKQIEGTTDFFAINSAKNYFSLLEMQKEALLNDLAQAKLITEQKRKVLQEKMKKSASLEKLREKEYKNYEQEVLLQEEIAVDDVISSRYNNNR